MFRRPIEISPIMNPLKIPINKNYRTLYDHSDVELYRKKTKQCYKIGVKGKLIRIPKHKHKITNLHLNLLVDFKLNKGTH